MADDEDDVQQLAASGEWGWIDPMLSRVLGAAIESDKIRAREQTEQVRLTREHETRQLELRLEAEGKADERRHRLAKEALRWGGGFTLLVLGVAALAGWKGEWEVAAGLVGLLAGGFLGYLGGFGHAKSQ